MTTAAAKMKASKAYLGDGVYIAHDGRAVLLSTEDGITTTNLVVLEPEVLGQMLRWYQRHEKEIGR